ncbi:ankyrin repeat domain-containing protein [Rickettsiales bacterium]|nr:ankyrin repeat domain-containing protein [Rickettsiales bacterium]
MRGSRHRTCTINELISAIRQKRDIAEIRQIISGVEDINQASTSSYDEGRTPLHIAAQNGHPEIVKLLLDRGAEVNQAGRYGTTPLHIAAHRGHREAVQLLLDRGAEVNQSDNDGTTPLCIAVINGHREAVQLLLDRGAEVNQADDDGETPLYIAVINGHREAVQLLLDRGAEVNQSDNDGTTPLCIAAFRGHAAVALLLKLAGAKRGDIDFEKNDAVIKQAIKTSDLLQIITQRFPESSADLHTALDKSLDNITDIDTLLKFSINLENKFNQIIHPISTANISHMVNQFLPGKLPDKLIGEISNLKILVLDEQDLRSAINNTGAIVAQIITDRLKESAAQERSFASRVNVSLLIAVYDGDTETVQLLTTKGANVNQTRTIDKATLLWIAAQNGHTATVEILLDRGAYINKATIIGTTPLCIAAQNGHTATVEILLDRGADEKSLTKKQQALYAEEIAKAKQEFKSTIVDTARALALNLHGTPYEEVAQIVPYVIEAKGADEKLEPNAIYNIALEALAKVAKAELLGKIIGQEKTLLSRYPTSRTKFENLGSFSSRVCDQSAGINCIFMK